MCSSDRLCRLAVLLLPGLCTVTGFLTGCSPQACGIPEVQPASFRIVGGHDVTPGSLPWTAMLAWCDTVRCGGAILGNRFILTAAHCFDESTFPCLPQNTKDARSPEHWSVYLGKQKVYKSNAGEQVYRVSDVFIHPLYDSRNFTNDIALLRLSSDIEYSKLIRPICLPTATHSLRPGDPCIVAGYGDSLSGGPYSLKQVTVPIISDEQCSQPDWYGHDFYSPPEQFCAGYEQGGSDACAGDSGSPLNCKFDGKWYASGIVSRGLDCAVRKKPGIYTNVSYHSYWIRTVVARYGFLLSCA